MERRRRKELGRMGNEMGNGMDGMRIDRRNMKGLTKMGKKMDY
jgi:hypothetical protein